MTTANEAFFDSLVRHQIGLQRLSAGIRKDIIPLLDATEKDLVEQILRKLDPRGSGKPVTFNSRNVRRMQNLQAVVGNIRNAAISDAFKVINVEMKALVKAEPVFVANSLVAATPVVIDAVLPPADLLLALVTSKPFEGRTLRGWARDIAKSDIDRINGQIQIGMVQGETAPQIARRVVGTTRLAGTNGATELTRRHAVTIVNTAVNHYSNQAKSVFYQANAKLFEEELYVATLDGVTTRICSSLDGRKFPIAEGPTPPLHFRCRSLRVAIIGKDATGSRPIKPVTEKGLVREFTGKAGTRKDIPFGQKGKFDQFARTRTRELVGQTPAKTTYQQFLERQTSQFQDDTLGITKAKLFRDGDLKLTRYVDRAGNELTLRQLAILEKDAFLKAGLDPKDFL